MTREEMIANKAASIAVHKTFAILGVDVDSPKEVEEFRQDLRFAGAMRKQAARGFGALVVVIIGGLVAALWAGVQVKMGGGT
jgi:hypothetical protein